MPVESSQQTPNIDGEIPPKKRSFFGTVLKYLFIAIVLGVCFALLAFWQLTNLNEAPASFPVDTPITIEAGMDVRSIIAVLADANVVQSESLLYYALVLLHEPNSLKASSYVFESPLTTLEVANRLTEGDFDTDLIRFTNIEGERATLIAQRASVILPEFDPVAFVTMAEPLEGKLFPDTYFIPSSYTEEDLLDLLLETFDARLMPLAEKIAAHPLTLDEILVLASIIEREANDSESMKMVSGILQNRLDINMALQADASVEYVLDKPLSELTPDDLKIDSPYNTYLNTGLPPTPIGNPGLDSITAVLEPTVTENFFYITDDDGKFHYAETYNQHLRNIEKYLR